MEIVYLDLPEIKNIQWLGNEIAKYLYIDKMKEILDSLTTMYWYTQLNIS